MVDVRVDGAVEDDTLVAREWAGVTEVMSFVPGPNVRLHSLVLHGLAMPVVHNFILSSPEGFSALSTMS